MASCPANNTRYGRFFTVFCLFFTASFSCAAQSDSLALPRDSIRFEGQWSAWAHYNPSADLPLQGGTRYLPGLHYLHRLPKQQLLDAEASLNLYGSVSTLPFSRFSNNGNLAPYRLWLRYSAPQWELRLGLQKINFGSATLLRPLMWFDQIDARDPLQITNGVWGMLGRYYFLNNANVWLWCLYGNRAARPWDIGLSSKNYPETGGRVQVPVPKGEMGLSFHNRRADLAPGAPNATQIPENRIGLDGRFDFGAGLWFEAAWIGKKGSFGVLNNQHLLNLGLDYTFGIGNGLHVTAEQLFFADGAQAFDFQDKFWFSALSASYPAGISDNLSMIVFVDTGNGKAYNFLNWQHIFRHFSTYCMAYWNPKTYNLPQQGNNSGSSYAGAGLQILFVLNH